MDHSEPLPLRQRLGSRFRFIVFICTSIAIACVMVVVALQLYNWSGAAELDFSLPSYNAVRQKINPAPNTSFSSTGAINQSTINQFNQQFDTQLQQIQQSNDFSSPALSDGSLGIVMPKD